MKRIVLIIIVLLCLSHSWLLAEESETATKIKAVDSDQGDHSDSDNKDAPHLQIQLTFPDDVALKTVLDYIAARLRINILYDDAVAKQKITIRSPQSVSSDQLLPLLRSALKFRNLALVDAEKAGWLTVVPADKLIQESRWSNGDQLEMADFNRVVTHVLRLNHTASSVFQELVQNYLSKPGGNLTLLPDGQAMIVTDYATVVDKILRIKELTDVPGAARGWRVFELQKASSRQVASTLPDLIAKTGLARVGKSDAKDADQGMSVLALSGTQNILVIGSENQLAQVEPLVKLLDVRVEQTTKIYPLKFATVTRAASLLQQIAKPELVAKQDGQTLTVSSDIESNSLIVTASQDEHIKIAQWVAEMIDRPSSMTPTGMATRVFMVKFARASELIQTLQSVFEGSVATDGIPLQTGESSANLQQGAQESKMPGSPDVPHTSGAKADLGGGKPNTSVTDPNATNRPNDNLPSTRNPESSGTVAGSNTKRPTDQASLFQSSNGQQDIHFTVDVPTNSIICTAPTPVLQQVSQLITRLDHHRPQVLIDATIVSMSRSNAKELGLEIQYMNSNGGSLSEGLLTSFGLFDVDATAGSATATIGDGLNAVLLRSDDVSVILRALQTKINAHVLSRPRLLVADNETGTLNSVDEQPYTSVNTNNTVSTTSFGGYAEAGTQIVLTPHISESDVVHLEYNIVSSSFTGASDDASTPPPRSTDSISSKVTIPSGYTLLVGGLVRRDRQETHKQVPGLGDIPILGDLFKSQSDSDTENMLFVFLNPVIHREDRFVYLRYISHEALRDADLDPTAPPLEMEWVQ